MATEIAHEMVGSYSQASRRLRRFGSAKPDLQVQHSLPNLKKYKDGRKEGWNNGRTEEWKEGLIFWSTSIASRLNPDWLNQETNFELPVLLTWVGWMLWGGRSVPPVVLWGVAAAPRSEPTPGRSSRGPQELWAIVHWEGERERERERSLRREESCNMRKRGVKGRDH